MKICQALFLFNFQGSMLNSFVVITYYTIVEGGLSRLFKNFLKDCYKHSQKLNKLEQKELLYENALRGVNTTNAMHSREFILKKLQEIDTDKTKFL